MKVKFVADDGTEFETQEECEKYEEENSKKAWKLKNGEEYFIINTYGDTDISIWKNDEYDNRAYLFGNCFKTKEEAEFTIDKLKVIAELKRFAEENNKPIDWTNPNQRKYFLYYDYTEKCVTVVAQNTLKGNNIYFSSIEIAEKVRREIGDEVLKKWYFEVE